MRLIGLTGGIATGKSTVAAMLTERDAVIIDSDVLAREVVEPGQPALDDIVREFGDGVLDGGGRLDRAALAAIVFADPERRRRLEAITHPRIATLTAKRVAAALDSGAPLVVVDIPLLYEAGRESLVEGVLVVYAPPAVQLRRLRARDGMPEEEARRRLAAQMPIDDKRARATWIIDNGGDVEDTAAQVAAWWAEAVSAPPARRG